jgi:hypothetical protein
MTDKQIIIDGVDVSGCSCHYNGWSQLYRDIRDMCDKGYDLECKPKENGCYHYTKCLEEQLKAKEQECEELKEKVKKYGEINEQETKDYAELKAENKILKEKFEIAIKNNMDKTLLRLEKGDVQEELQEIREQFGIETLYCHDDNTRVHRCLDVLRLKDTLTEIKEIVGIGLVDGLQPEEYSGFLKILQAQILQKISECEVEND